MKDFKVGEKYKSYSLNIINTDWSVSLHRNIIREIK